MGKVGFMAVLDSDTGKIMDTVPIPEQADDLAFDEATHRLYVPGGGGYLAIYDTEEPDHLKEFTRIKTRKGAATGLLIPEVSTYLLAVPETDGKPAAVLIFDVH